MKKTITIFVALVLFPALAVSAPKTASKSITTSGLKAHVEFLASAELQGRGVPGLGSEIAQRYIATRFEEYGLDQFPELNGYYQNVPLVVGTTDYENSGIIVKRGDSKIELTANRDVFFFPKGGRDADVTAQLLLCGYGIRAPEYEYDDFGGVDPEGKILLAFNGEPKNDDGSSLLSGEKRSRYSNYLIKAGAAEDMGALGLILLQPPVGELPPIEEILGRYKRTMHDPIVQLTGDGDWFSVFYATAGAVASLIGESFDLSVYQLGIEKERGGDPRLIDGMEITLHIRFKDVQETSTANVVGFWPGKTEEAVVIMAHHDHEGVKGGKVYFGADDNASGTAGLLCIAQAFSDWGKTPHRSVIFLSSGAEEKGCLGAEYFLKNAPIPTENIVAVINMDMIGRDGSSQFRAMMDPSIEMEKDLLMGFYSGQTPMLAEVASEENRDVKLNLVLEPVLRFHSASDHVPFHNMEIPSIFLFTGFHTDYTSPNDTADKILYGKLQRVVRLAFGMVYEIAQNKERPIFDRSITDVKRSDRQYGY